MSTRATSKITDREGTALSRERAQTLLEHIVELSKADSVRVTLKGGVTHNIRFAANQVSSSGSIEDLEVNILSAFGAREASIRTNDISEEGLRRAVERSEKLARLAPENPEAMPELGPQKYRDVPAYSDSTARMSPEDRAAVAAGALLPAREVGDLMASGYLEARNRMIAIGNNLGLFAYHRSTDANYTITARTHDGTGSGWAAGYHNDVSKIDFDAVSARAIEKARASRNPAELEPGHYTVIFEAAAVADLIPMIGYSADARTADEGRSPFAKSGGGTQVGERIADPRTTLISDPFDPMILSQPFDDEGLPLERRVIIDKGRLEQLSCSRYWAKKQSRQPVSFAGGLKLEGGAQSTEDLIRSTERGVLVTRLWYIRSVDPRTLLHTGLTRDGTFLIENGRIVRSIKNFRFNDSPLFMLNNLDALGPVERVAGTYGVTGMPAMKVKSFNFASLSDAV